MIERLVAEYTQGDAPEHWDIVELFDRIDQIFPISFGPADINVMGMERHDLVDTITEEAIEAYDDKEEELSAELLRDLERHVLLEIIDERWREHLNDMDYLREGIHLRGFAEMQPIVAYKNEGFTMFGELMDIDLGRVRPRDLPLRADRRGPARGARPASSSKQSQDLKHRSSSTTPASDGPQYGVGAAVAANMAEARDRRRRRQSPTRTGGVIPRPAQITSTAGGGNKAAPAGYDPDGNPMSRNQHVLVRIGQEVQELPRQVALAAQLRISC